MSKAHLNTAAPFCLPKSARLRFLILGCSARCDEAACSRAGQGARAVGAAVRWRWRGGPANLQGTAVRAAMRVMIGFIAV